MHRPPILRLFVGFETFSPDNLRQSNKKQNLKKDYDLAVRRLHDHGIMIKGSFVFGLDDDGPDVFARTVEWGVRNAITTSTYHVLTPYPGTRLFSDMEAQGRLVTRDWDRYDTRHVVYRPAKLSPDQLEAGYWWAYRHFYSWPNIVRASLRHDSAKHVLKHFAYTAGWKKFEPVWYLLIMSHSNTLTSDAFQRLLSKLESKS